MHYNVKDTTTVISASNYVAGKLNAIPMILGPGFATAIIPHISEALSKKNYKLVKKMLLTALTWFCMLRFQFHSVFLRMQGL